ncbi:MAG: cell wall-binding repeat-containing protein [Coriobacteriia bacterium]|nr:cell wall-binding repeat-containing protein [Coriobacteriia bacterium]
MAISRSLVIDRARRWVGQSIPYSQSGWADLYGTIVESSTLGWRRDCSGFVSMAWNLPRPGATTRTLQQYATPIGKAALQPGDILVSYNNHTVIFGGWADALHTAYYAYEMSSSVSRLTGSGTIMRVTPYPYWGNDTTYLPYRLDGITDNIDYSKYLTGVSGSNRYETAIATSRVAFEDGSSPSVIIASGENWPDALSASSLAGTVEGPILLTRASSLPAGLTGEIARLGATEAIIVGGPSAVSTDVAQALGGVKGLTVKRIGGADRYETSRLIAEETTTRVKAAGGTPDPAAFITTGLNFPDALAASPIAYAKSRPILLTAPNKLSEHTRMALDTSDVYDTIILGDTRAVSASVETSLTTLLGGGTHLRISGANRYGTARAVATYARMNGLSYENTVIATGENFPDALAGGALAARLRTVLMLTPTKTLDAELSEMILAEPESFGKPYCLGSDAAIQPIVRESIALSLGAQ